MFIYPIPNFQLEEYCELWIFRISNKFIKNINLKELKLKLFCSTQLFRALDFTWHSGRRETLISFSGKLLHCWLSNYTFLRSVNRRNQKKILCNNILLIINKNNLFCVIVLLFRERERERDKLCLIARCN